MADPVDFGRRSAAGRLSERELRDADIQLEEIQQMSPRDFHAIAVLIRMVQQRLRAETLAHY